MSLSTQHFATMAPTRLFFRCAIPSMIAMAVTSLYTIADGIFVGRFLGAEALAAVNLVMPFVLISFVFPDLIAVGSSVQIAIRLGEKRENEASRIFTVCSLLIIAASFVIGFVGYVLAEPVLHLMGADASVAALATEYVRVYAVFAPLIMVFYAVDNYLRICGKPRYSMTVTVVTSLLNIFLDFLFLGPLHMGIGAAALASCLCMSLGTVLNFLPFLFKKLPLRFVCGGISLRMLGQICYNGSSEFFSSVSGSLLMVVLNSVLLHLAGSAAVAAFSIVLYVDSVAKNMLFGMADALQPAISYCYGAELRRRIVALEKRVMLVGAVVAALAFALMHFGGGALLSLFLQGESAEVTALAMRSMELFSFGYLVCWLNIALSSFFTGVNCPGSSLGISLGNALVFPLLGLIILVPLWGLDGVWLCSAFGNVLTAITGLVLLGRFWKRRWRQPKEEKVQSPVGSGEEACYNEGR